MLNYSRITSPFHTGVILHHINKYKISLHLSKIHSLTCSQSLLIFPNEYRIAMEYNLIFTLYVRVFIFLFVESVPLKNKAIHQWMSQDKERLYTADDICKAGIRYRFVHLSEH